VTQSLVAGPVIFLYATGVLLAKFAERGREEIPAPAETPAGGSD
jgi:hypothetical protein